MRSPRATALVLACLTPLQAWAHGPAAMGLAIMWDFMLILAALIYLAAGPQPLSSRLTAIGTAALVAVIALLGTLSLSYEVDPDFVVGAIVNGIAPLAGFFGGRYLFRYLAS